MSFANKRKLGVLIVAACTLIVGCSTDKSNTAAPPANTSSNGAMPAEPAAAPPAGEQPAGLGGADSEITKALAQLLPEDRALAEKQKICPVSGEKLGSMGTPKKLNVAGHVVFTCCESCAQTVTDEPEKYLAKIGIKLNEGPALK